MSPSNPTFVTLALILTMILSAAPAAAEAASRTGSCSEEAPCGVRVVPDLAYYSGSGASPDKHKLDLYLPDGVERPPVVVWIHGGAWILGGRKGEEAVARRFAERGLAFAAISYRLSPGTWRDPSLTEGIQHPEHAIDCARAVAWIHRHAGAHGYDAGRIVLSGYSAGGHLSALLAIDPSYLKDQGLSPEALHAVVPMAGAYDMEAYHRAHVGENGQAMADGHVKGVFGHGEGDLKRGSPTTFLDGETAPMLVVAESQTRAYTQLFEGAVAGKKLASIEFLYFDDETHASLFRGLGRRGPHEPRRRIIDWIRKVTASN